MDSLRVYKEQIKVQYELAKSGPYGAFLSVPSQGNLRDLCIEICQEASQADLLIFRRFMGYDFDPAGLQRILQDREKFRPITNFLNGKTELATPAAADMLALLVRFEPRPFTKFLESQTLETKPYVKKEVGMMLPETSGVNEIAEPTINDRPQKPEKLKEKDRRRLLIYVAIAAIVMAGIFLTDNIISLRSECMAWTGDHYEAVKCDSMNGGVPMKKSEFTLRRVPVWDTTTFFRNDKLLYWYSKKNGKYVFYNQPGQHPTDPTIDIRKVSKDIADSVRKGKIKIDY